jgi:hypothetical protein
LLSAVALGRRAMDEELKALLLVLAVGFDRLRIW